jgi:hypothetical protein
MIVWRRAASLAGAACMRSHVMRTVAWSAARVSASRVAVRFERRRVLVELPAVELDDQLVGREVSVEDVAEERLVHQRLWEVVFVAERGERVLPVRAARAVAGRHEWLDEVTVRVAVEQLLELGLEHLGGVEGVVDRAGPGLVGEPRRHVVEGPGRRGDGDVELRRDVPGSDGLRAVRVDAVRAAIAAQDRDLERLAPALPEAPEGHRGGVGEDGVRAAGEDGGGAAFERRRRRLPTL